MLINRDTTYKRSRPFERRRRPEKTGASRNTGSLSVDPVVVVESRSGFVATSVIIAIVLVELIRWLLAICSAVQGGREK